MGDYYFSFGALVSWSKVPVMDHSASYWLCLPVNSTIGKLSCQSLVLFRRGVEWLVHQERSFLYIYHCLWASVWCLGNGSRITQTYRTSNSPDSWQIRFWKCCRIFWFECFRNLHTTIVAQPEETLKTNAPWHGRYGT